MWKLSKLFCKETMTDDEAKEMEKWIADHPIIHGIISFFGISLLIIIHFSLCFFSIISGVQYEYYHGPKIKWPWQK